MKRYGLFFSVLFIYSTGAFAEADHTEMMHNEHQMTASYNLLTEAGNDVFGTIQEVIIKLNNDPNTDWGKVDIEALRQHLLDMNDLTLNVEVMSQKPIKNGLEAIIRPVTDRAEVALDRVLSAHPSQLKDETNWTMTIVKNKNQFILTTTSENPEETNKIRGLGYIGLMAYGNHHQPHHWSMATGNNPHDAHH